MNFSERNDCGMTLKTKVILSSFLNDGRHYYTQATAWAQAKMKLYTVLQGQCTKTMHFTSKITLTVKSPSESELKLMRNVIKPVGQMDKNENSMDMTL